MIKIMMPSIIAFMLGSLLPYEQSVAEQTSAVSQLMDIKPVFALPLAPATLPLRESLFEADPAMRGWIDTVDEAKKTERQITAVIDLLGPNGAKADKAKLEKIYIGASRLVIYYADTQKSGPLSAAWRTAKILQFGKEVLGAGEKLAALNSGERRAAIIYQMHYVNVMVNPALFESEVAELLKIKDDLPPKLKKSVDLLLAVSFTESSITYSEGMNKITANMSELRTPGQIAINLCLAKALVGVNQSGERVTPAVNPAYVKNVELALHLAIILPQPTRQEIFAYALWLWEMAQIQGQRDITMPSIAAWARFDFDPSYYRDTPSGIAAREWVMVGKFFPGDLPSLIAGYKKLQTDLKDNAGKIKIDHQMLGLYKKSYAQTGNHATFAAALAELTATYGAKALPGVNPKAWTAMGRQLALEEYNFYLQLLALAAKADASAAMRGGVAAETQSYLTRANLNGEQQTMVKEGLARFYMQTLAYQQAADVYLELTNKNLPKYLPLAIQAQSKLAPWPLEPDFRLAAPAAAKTTHAQLITSYSLLIKAMGKKSDLWAIVNLGILQINQGRESAGSASLQYAVELYPSDKMTGHAAGWLLVNYMNKKDYRRVIEIAGMVNSKKVVPVDPATNMIFPLDTKLPIALLAAAQTQTAKGDYVGAIKYLVSLVNGYPHAPEHEEGNYLLAQDLYSAKQLPTAVKVLADYCDKYPASKRLESTLLTGALWASQAKMPDYVILFYNRYLTAFNESPKVPKVRSDLALTYFAKKHYGDALTQYKNQMDDHKASMDDKIIAALSYLNTEELFGDMQDGVWCANALITLAGRNNVKATMAAYGYLGRNALRNGNIKGLTEVEKSLLSWDATQPDVNEALGFVRFYLVKNTLKPIVFDENPKMLQDPKKAITQINDQFAAIKKQYEQVCPKSIHRYCAPMLYELAGQALIAKNAISDIQVTATLGEGDVKAFNLFREQYIQQLNAIAQNSMSTAVSLAKQEKVDAGWKNKILYLADQSQKSTPAH